MKPKRQKETLVNTRKSSIAGQFCTRMLADYGAEVLLEDAHPGQQPPGARFSVRFPARLEGAG